MTWKVDRMPVLIVAEILGAESDTLIEKLRQHVRRVYKVSPSAEFNRAPITAIDNVPYDVMALHLSGK